MNETDTQENRGDRKRFSDDIERWQEYIKRKHEKELEEK